MPNPNQPPADHVPEEWDEEAAARDEVERTEPQKLEAPPPYPQERPHFLDPPHVETRAPEPELETEDEPDTDVELPSEDAPPSNEL